jgi:hypothetical protein
MFADYRVPQSLLYFGVLEYSEELNERLKSTENYEIPHNHHFEMEIRAASIISVDLLLKNFLKADGIPWNAIMVDYFLWDYAKQHGDLMAHLPIHRTRCVYY